MTQEREKQGETERDGERGEREEKEERELTPIKT